MGPLSSGGSYNGEEGGRARTSDSTQRKTDLVTAGFKDGAGATSQGQWGPLEAGKRMKQILLGASRGNQPRGQLDVSPRRPTPDS